jgi:aminoglycoside phosphotransferase (APT) family kinase protein
MSEIWYSRRPQAEQHVDEERARRLVREQFPGLRADEVRLLDEGWDYVVHRVDGEWAFRFPRRDAVVPGTDREIAVLPLLEVPLAIPRPEYVGVPSDGYPWPFYGARYIPGREAAGLDDDARTRLARPLARFLRALHAHALDLPVDLQRRSDMSYRAPRTRQALAAIGDLWQAPPLVEDVLRAAEALPPAEPTAVVHGDLHFRQLLVHDGELSGVIDWVDVCRADPGVDLLLYWSFLPPAGREAFLEEYPAVAEHSLLRGRVLALFLNAILARYGRDEGAAAVEAEAVASLARTVFD